MRKVLWAVALVAASFAGGAAANGPLLKGARAWLAPEEPEADPVPVLDAQLARSRGDVARPAAPTDEPKGEDAEAPTPPADEPKAEPEPEPKPAEPIAEAPPEPTAAVAQAPKPQPDPSFGDAPGSPPAAAALAPTREPEPPAPLDTSIRPAASAAPREPEAPAPAGSGWDGVARQLKELGVGRYWIEGEPGGPARFRCAVPVAGQRSVSQQFEAEGPDPVAAAESALRRLRLWRATEAP